MAITTPRTPGVTPAVAPAGESFDAARATEKSGGEERPGFGGLKDSDVLKDDFGPPAIPGGPPDPVPAGTEAARTAGDGKPGEASQATSGAVRPPQSTSADQTSTQGKSDDAA